MSEREVFGIAKSIGKWTWAKFIGRSSTAAFSARQRERALSRWKGHVKQEPWKQFGVSKRTWMRWRKTGKAAEMLASLEAPVLKAAA